MPWLWRIVGSPAANDIIAELRGVWSSGGVIHGMIFSLYGFFICHDDTARHSYVIETYREGTDETRTFIRVTLPPERPFIKLVSPDEPLIVGIGQWTGSYWEHLRVRSIEGGEPHVTVGLLVRGRYDQVTDMFG